MRRRRQEYPLLAFHRDFAVFSEVQCLDTLPSALRVGVGAGVSAVASAEEKGGRRRRRQEKERQKERKEELLKQPAHKRLEANRADAGCLEFRRKPRTFP